MMRFLIREGTLKDADPEIMAAQFSSPITVWINLCDRNPTALSGGPDLSHMRLVTNRVAMVKE